MVYEVGQMVMYEGKLHKVECGTDASIVSGHLYLLRDPLTGDVNLACKEQLTLIKEGK